MKNILITAANSQVGSYLAKRYASEGHKLFLFYHQKKERIEDICAHKKQVDLIDLPALIAAIEELNTPLDALIHCAAVRSEDAKALGDTDPDTYKKVFESNFYPAYNVLRALIPQMQKFGKGRMVLFGSDVGQRGLVNGSAYAAAKAAIANMVKSAAKEYAKENILINCISPGPIETDNKADFTGDYLKFRQEYFRKHIEKSASKKLVQFSELKLLVDMLIDYDLKNLIGQDIIINGGIE